MSWNNPDKEAALLSRWHIAYAGSITTRYQLPTLAKAREISQRHAVLAPLSHRNPLWAELEYPYNPLHSFLRGRHLLAPGLHDLPVMVLENWSIMVDHLDDHGRTLPLDTFWQSTSRGYIKSIQLHGIATPVVDADAGRLLLHISCRALGLTPAGTLAHGFYSHATRARWAAAKVGQGWDLRYTRTKTVVCGLILVARDDAELEDPAYQFTYAFATEKAWYFCTGHPCHGYDERFRRMESHAIYLHSSALVRAADLCGRAFTIGLTVKNP